MKFRPLKPTTIVTQSAQQISTCLDGEVVCLSVGKGRYFKMDLVGSRIWAIIAQPVRVRVLCDRLAATYSVAQEECEEHTLEFLEDLRQADLVSVKSEGEP